MYAGQTLADVAARNGHTPPTSLVSAAAVVSALVPTLRKHVEEAKLTSVYNDIDLPLTPVLYRMEKAGVRIDRDVLFRLSTRFAAEIERVSERVYELAGERFNIGSPKKLGEVLFTKMNLLNAE